MASTNYVIADSVSTDLDIAEAMVAELENYLVGNEVYRTITIPNRMGESPRPMSIGDLLTRVNRLHAVRTTLSATDENRLDNMATQFETTTHEMRSRFRELVEREIKTRLNSLNWFLQECAEHRERCRREFPFEMRNRQRIEEIVAELDEELSDEMAQQIAEIDAHIRTVAEEADFTWHGTLQPIYPRDPYWYLYMLPAQS